MSIFAGTVKTVVVPLSLKECLRMIPKELAIEIFSYLEMNIILELGVQFKPIILNCLKEAYTMSPGHRVSKSAIDVFVGHYSTSQLITYVLQDTPVHKHYIMRCFEKYQRELREIAEKKIFQKQKQEQLFAELNVGDILFHKQRQCCYLINKKNKASFEAMYIDIEFDGTQEIPTTLIISPILVSYRILKHNLFVRSTFEKKRTPANHLRFFRCVQSRQQHMFHVYNQIDNEIIGTFPREELEPQIINYYNVKYMF